jgi:dipeptidyl aminopeptidase/acylaminoacyl peptidase
MTTTAPHLNSLATTWRILVVALVAAALVANGATVTATATTVAQPAAPARRAAPPQVLTIEYTTHNGRVREATVLLPASYRPGKNPPIPLIVSPHGRGATGLSNSKFFGRMPTIGNFAVVSPDGMGRRLRGFSYGYEGQIDDLARMPRIVERKLPWVRIDHSRIYALGSSMGGQETLLLVARHGKMLAGAAAMDSVTDLHRRYRQVLELPTDPTFVERWGAPNGVCLQSAMRREVGATPDRAPGRYEARSPLSQARAIARSGVPLQIWWSWKDAIVFDQEHQSQALFKTLRKLGAEAPLIAYSGRWAHSKEMRAHALLPLALQDFGLLPRGFKSVPGSVHRIEVAS